MSDEKLHPARWCVEEADTGLPVAMGSAWSVEDAARECNHYAQQYRQDGPVRFWVRQNRQTLVRGFLSAPEKQGEVVMLNGLTRAETLATASVAGLSRAAK